MWWSFVVVLLSSIFLLATWFLRLFVLYYTSNSLSHIPVLSFVSFIIKVRLQSLILWTSGASQDLPLLPDVTQLSGQVLRIVGKNPSRMTLQGTNVYIVGTGSSRLVIDSSDGNAAFMRKLLQVCQRHGIQEISDVLLTHGHLDHVGGILMLKKHFPMMNVWKYLPVKGRKGDGDGDHHLRLRNQESRWLGIQALVNGQEFQVPCTGSVLTTVYTPGHCNDHVCFLLDHVDDHKAPTILFSGDCVLGYGSCMFDSLTDLMASLRTLSACNACTIYPGHGPVVSDAPTKIREYIAHRQQREDEILDVLKKYGDHVNGLSSSDIVTQIYQPLPYLLRLSARKAVEKHLQKLLAEVQVLHVRRAGWFQSATYSLIVDNNTPNKLPL